MKSTAILIIVIIIFLSGCRYNQLDNNKQAAQQIIDADKAMNEMAAKEGFYKAILTYADDSIVKPNEGEFPIIGKIALAKNWVGKSGPTTLSWEPFKAEASISGDIGYTLGNWKYITKDSILYGNYYTIWKKQINGSWKVVADGGNNTPQLEKK